MHTVAYSDSSFADNIDTGRTTLGFVVQVNGSMVSAGSWLSPRVDSCVRVNHSGLIIFMNLLYLEVEMNVCSQAVTHFI